MIFLNYTKSFPTLGVNIKILKKESREEIEALKSQLQSYQSIMANLSQDKDRGYAEEREKQDFQSQVRQGEIDTIRDGKSDKSVRGGGFCGR